MRLQAKAGYKLTEEEIEESLAKQRARPRGGFILDRDYRFWSRYITDGRLDTEKLQERRYRAEQYPYIAEEMEKLGWLKKDAPVAATALPESLSDEDGDGNSEDGDSEDEFDTGPLVQISEDAEGVDDPLY